MGPGFAPGPARLYSGACAPVPSPHEYPACRPHGQIGDILITEPVTRALKPHFTRAVLYTRYPDAGRLLDIYDEVLPYELKPAEVTRPGDALFHPLYEILPASITWTVTPKAREFAPPPFPSADRLPRVKGGWPRLQQGRYGLIAPETSSWMRQMRQWLRENFEGLKTRLEASLGFPFVTLEAAHSFSDMLSLIEHCAIFVGK